VRLQASTLHLHKFRVAFATTCLLAGIDLKPVQQWLGHTDLASTMRYLRTARGAGVRAGAVIRSAARGPGERLLRRPHYALRGLFVTFSIRFRSCCLRSEMFWYSGQLRCEMSKCTFVPVWR
jgi:Phage integrase family